jgi:hypothetical protein
VWRHPDSQRLPAINGPFAAIEHHGQNAGKCTWKRTEGTSDKRRKHRRKRGKRSVGGFHAHCSIPSQQRTLISIESPCECPLIATAQRNVAATVGQ